MKLAFGIALLVLPSVALGALVFGGTDTAKVCKSTLVNGTVKLNVPDPDDCSLYYVCTVWFQSKMACKNGNHFSAVEEKCTDPCSARCDTTLACSTTSAPEKYSTEAVQVTDDATSQTAVEDGSGDAVEATEGTEAAYKSTSEAATKTATDVAVETVTRETPSVPADAVAAVVPKAKDSVETTTTYWQQIVQHFYKPPATIPGVGGTAPTYI
ncbi:hypothetical protein BIW11_10270 [Tropilaelaps mercedesae]|uniref:Chitin-binding type-2 domain-containing protein n=1 Tax=Tropilaelaps mercedesae TaxID=418985 RepID=A0A1V9XGW4_9ACAR|nr:hypothetical protein BIW11_10270 [Tropilaelaps mercedesae]